MQMRPIPSAFFFLKKKLKEFPKIHFNSFFFLSTEEDTCDFLALEVCSEVPLPTQIGSCNVRLLCITRGSNDGRCKNVLLVFSN